MAKGLHAPALEGVDAHPFEVEVAIAEHRPQPRHHPLGLFFLFGVGIGAELKVDPPEIVGLAVQQDRLAGVKGRIEPEPALCRIVGLHQHIGDQESVVKDPAFALEPEQVTNRAARTVGDHQPVAGQLIRAVGRLDGEQHAIVGRLHAGHPVAPAQIECRQAGGARHQRLFEVVLLQVDEGRSPMTGFGEQIETVDLALAQENPSTAPADAAVDHRLAAAEAVEDLEGAFCVADRTRSDTDRLVVVQDHHRLSLHRQIDRSDKPDRAGADHDDRMPRRCTGVLVGAGPIVEDRVAVGLHRTDFRRRSQTSANPHAGMSRASSRQWV